MSTHEIPTVAPERLAEALRGGAAVELIDVCTPAEYEEAHAAAARSVPLDALDPDALARHGEGGAALYFICRTGPRARQACERLLARGFTNVAAVEGGTLAWERAGLPLARGRRAVSLERQVRIAAGALVLLGAVLALAVHPYLVGLSAFVGAGLVYSGVTDTCGMAAALARMPWNRAR